MHEPVSADASYRERPGAAGSPWVAVPALTRLPVGSVTFTEVSGTRLVVARPGPELLAYIDWCPRCEGSLRGAVLSRRLGVAAGEAVLRCPGCGACYDVCSDGASLDAEAIYLAPVPLVTVGSVSSVLIDGAGPT